MLNESKGNMYPFVTHTWNAIKGRCPHDCVYCYMKIWPQKELRLVESEFKTNLGENNFIFVGSSTDMWADDVPIEWIKRVLEYCANIELIIRMMKNNRAEDKRLLRKERRESGLCPNCGAARDVEGRLQCSKCLEKKRNVRSNRTQEQINHHNRVNVNCKRRLYNYRLEHRLCPNCGGKRTDGFIYCDKCRAINRARYHNETPEQRERRRQVSCSTKVKRYHKNKTENMCVSCSRQNNNGKAQCDYCLARHNEYRANRIIRKLGLSST